MSLRETHPPARSDGPGQTGDAYVRLEEARLRCEHLAAQAATEHQRGSLRGIHRELGMAGWLASSGLDSDQRLWLLGTARRRSQRPVLGTTNAIHALAATTIRAEDAVARNLSTGDPSDELHLAHLHLLHAEELLHTHLLPGPA